MAKQAPKKNKAKAKPKKSGSTREFVRYSEAQINKILTQVGRDPSTRKRGSIAKAARQHGVTANTISRWLGENR